MIDRDSDALGSIVEGAGGAEATTIGLKSLASRALDTVDSIPEGAGGAAALSID